MTKNTHRPGRPTPEQLAWQDLEFGMFIHFAPNTWQDQQGDTLTTPLDQINPKKLDVAQWVDVAESMGARYIVFVAKHIGGFCMWPTKTTHYSIAGTPWRDGKGDVCRELADECHKRDMPYGFYLSPRDDHFGVAVGGKARSGNPRHQSLYNSIYRQQLTELLAGYGKQGEVWFDGSVNGKLVRPIIREHQPGAMVFQSSAATIRWVGNEDGVAPYPTWNTVKRGFHEWTPELNTWKSGPALAGGKGTVWLPAECDVPIRRDWFWTTTNEPTLKSLDHLMDIYYRSVGHGCNLLLNHTPDTTGLIPESDVRRAAEFGREIRKRLSNPLAATSGRGKVVELDLPCPAVLDHVVTMEDLSDGERVLEYNLEALDGTAWRSIARGSAVGHKKIDRVEPVRTNRIRWTCEKSVGEPRVRNLAAFGKGN